MVPDLDLHCCSLQKSDKMLGNKPPISFMFSSTLINLMIYEHSCKILYLYHSLKVHGQLA